MHCTCRNFRNGMSFWPYEFTKAEKQSIRAVRKRLEKKYYPKKKL